MTLRPLASIRARLVARVREESGFSLMEAVIAMMLFAIIATAMLSVLTAGVSAQRLSRQRTIAEQASTAEAEYIRTLAYSKVGNPGGNPNGTIPLTQSVAAVLGGTYPGLQGTVTTKVEWNNDPNDKVATAYRNAAFYKKITITVTRASDGKQLSQFVTFVSDTNGGTGVNDAEIDLSLTDIGSNTPVVGQTVNLTTGPSAPLSDTTDSAGDITFPALTANPTSGPTAYYNLSMTPLAGYTLLKDDDVAQTPSSPAAHVQLAPSQTFPTTMRMYKGSTISVVLQDASTGLAYLGNATVTLSTTLRTVPTSQNFAYSGGIMTTSTFAGENIIPAPSPVITGGYTASVSNGFFATSVLKSTVPNTYPTDLTSTYTLTGYPTGTLTATVTWAGSPVSGATVTLTGGPTSTNQSTTTNGSGVATFTDIPAGSGYSLTAAKNGETSAAAAATVTAGASTNVPIAMPVGNVAVTVSSAGSPIVGATVTLTGGNISGTITAGSTTDVNGQVTITNVPKGSGVTVTATKGLQTGSQSPVTVPNGSTVAVTVAMPLGSIAVTATWTNGTIASCSNCVTLSGGALGSSVVGSTDATGKVTFINVPAASGYTVTIVKGGQTGTANGITVTGGATTPVSVAMPVGAMTVTVTWAGNNVNGATVQISGGNITGTLSGTTNSSGVVTISNIPSGAGATITATSGGQTGTATPVTIPNGSTGTQTITLPTGSVLVTVTWAAVNVTGATVQLSGGNISGTITAGSTTNSSGQVTVTNVPVGSGVTVTATKSGQTGQTAGVTVTAAGPNNVTVTLPTGSIVVNAKWAGQPVANCANCVTLSGGNLMAGNVLGTTDASGNVTFSSVPYGNGYTVSVVKGTGSGSNVVNLSSASTSTNVTLTPVANLTVTVTWAGVVVNGATVNVTLGPNSGQTYVGTTNASGQAVISVPVGSGYTATVPSFNGGTGSTAAITVASGGSSATVTLTQTKSVTVTVTGGAGNASKTVTIEFSNGPNTGQLYSTTLALNASGNGSKAVTVAVGAGTYTLKVYNCATGNPKFGSTTVSAAAAPTTAAVTMSTNPGVCP